MALLVQSCISPADEKNKGEKLLDAVEVNNFEEVERLLELGADPNYKQSPNHVFTPFLSACEKGYDSIVKIMIVHGAILNPPQREFELNQPLAQAAMNGHLSTCQILIDSGSIVDGLNAYDQTNLFLAIDFNQVESARFLIANGADIHKPNFFGVTPFEAACIWGFYDLVSEIIENHNANVNITDNQTGETPLMRTASAGQYEVFILLYENGANLDAVDNDGNGMMYYAELGENTQIINFVTENLM